VGKIKLGCNGREWLKGNWGGCNGGEWVKGNWGEGVMEGSG